ncbi:MAG: DUF4340 domain-containing protein, partial [Candidatus Eremiobacteraeota bacterium]|nr:DUF4340 domain-containing protein [Candidatus Eremiobacteraeota bacterium]
QLFLLIAVMGLGSFYAWSKVHKLETTEKEYQEARYYPELTEEQVSKIKVVSKEPAYEYELVSHGDEWFIDSHLLNIEKAHQLVSSIIELNKEREMDPAPTPEREKEFGMDEPSYQLTVWKESEDLGTVKLGDRVPDYNHFYGQWAKGGDIWTVPAYTLSVLEEEPKALTEAALLPVQATSVKTFSVVKAGEKILELKQNDDDTFAFVEPKGGRADESRVSKFLNKLKDLKVGRFLGPEEETAMGETVVAYEAKLGYSKYRRITELKQRVAVKPELVYGRRYLEDPETKEPVENTLERFVVEIPESSDVMNPEVAMFQDRRVLVFDMDKVKGLEVKEVGKTYNGAKNVMGKWETKSGSDASEESLNGLLWVLKDLRYEDILDKKEKSPERLSLTLTLDGGEKLELSFTDEGDPVAWRGTKGYKISTNSWDTLTDAVAKI